MAITRQQKENHVSEIKDLISKSKVIVIWDYLGLNAEEISDIRVSIRNENASNKVYKNTVASIAFKESGKEEIIKHLEGPSSFLFIEDEDSKALATLNKYVKNNDKISFKAGYIDGEFYDKEAITEIAGLPSKEDLLSMLLSALQGTIRNLAYAVSQISATKEEKQDEVKTEDSEEKETSKTEEEKTSSETNEKETTEVV